MISAPFNFVPLSSKVYYPGWAKQVSQDIPFSDGEDGVIELTIVNQTPLFTRNGHTRSAEEPYSSHILNPDKTRRYFIPGTTLKGCFRSVMEILSFGKMTQYNDDSFGMPREFDTKNSANKPYMDAVKNAKCGWLKQVEGGKYIIQPCKKGVQKIHYIDILKYFMGFYAEDENETLEARQKSLQGDGIYPVFHVNEGTISYKENNQLKDVPAGDYKVVCTGYIEGKKHEYLFSEQLADAKEVDDAVFKAFESIHSRNEAYGNSETKGFLYKLLHDDKQQIPVFYVEQNGEIVAIGLTRMLRYPYKYTVGDAVKNACPDIKREKPDLAEIIFGYIHGNEQQKGRVVFSHAFCKNEAIADDKLIDVSGVLGQPKASYYPFYLSQNSRDRKYVTYDTAGLKIAGRKRYRISDGSTFQLPQNEKNDKVVSHFLALPANNVFHSKVIVHNLRKAEIGALLSAITMNQTKGCFHNLGLAKSFGYGKIKCSVSLKGLQYDEETYIRAFEEEMICAGFDMNTESGLQQLVAIASPHKSEDMQMMDLEGYGNGKNNEEFSMLSENPKHIATIVLESEKAEIKQKRRMEEDAKRKQEEEYKQEIKRQKELQNEAQRKRDQQEEFLANTIDAAGKCMNASQWSDAIGLLNEAEVVALELGADTSVIESKRLHCQQQLAAKQSQSLSDALLGKTTLGNVQGTTSTWCKNHPSAFSDVELQALVTAIKVLPDKEQKKLPSMRSKFEKTLTADWTTKLYNLI